MQPANSTLTLLRPPPGPPAPGTGSELVMAVDAAKKLEAEGKKVRHAGRVRLGGLLWCGSLPILTACS